MFRRLLRRHLSSYSREGFIHPFSRIRDTRGHFSQAIFEAKVLAVVLLQRFSFSIDPAEAKRITYSLTLTMNICNNKDADLKDRTYELMLKATPRK